MTDAILSNREGGILTLTFHRLDKKNAITRAMYSALAQALEEAAADDTVRVAVIQGDPTCFTAGNDLMDFLSNPPDMSPGAEPAIDLDTMLDRAPSRRRSCASWPSCATSPSR